MSRFAGWIAVLAFTCLMPLGSAGFAKNIDAPAIANDAQAKQMCPQICKTSGGTWNGNWKTPKGRATSVCGCDIPEPPKGPKKINVNAPEINNDQQADQICPGVCRTEDRSWKGEWKKSGGGRGSQCTCYRK